jgi:hypothetical protein
MTNLPSCGLNHLEKRADLEAIRHAFSAFEFRPV